MSDAIRSETKKLTDKLVVDSKEQLKRLKKVKAMAKLAHDMGEQTDMFDKLTSVAETVLKDIIGKLEIKK